jgi:hypothetical protein
MGEGVVPLMMGLEGAAGLRVVLWLHAYLGLDGIRVVEQFALAEVLEQMEVAEDVAVSISRGHLVEKKYESETIMRSSYSNMYNASSYVLNGAIALPSISSQI